MSTSEVPAVKIYTPIQECCGNPVWTLCPIDGGHDGKRMIPDHLLDVTATQNTVEIKPLKARPHFLQDLFSCQTLDIGNSYLCAGKTPQLYALNPEIGAADAAADEWCWRGGFR